MDLHEDDLALAARHVREGKSRISRQRELIRKLAQHGYDTTEAESLLGVMQQTLSLMEYHHRLLLSERNSLWPIAPWRR